MQKNIYPGKFIVFDGLDGSGQTTQAEKLVDYFNRPQQKLEFKSIGAHYTKEPTSNLIGGLIRSQLSHDWKSSAECLQLLFTADRAYHLEKEIIPLLKRGVMVISDRYLFSTLAFGSSQIKDRDWLKEINKNFLLPDFTFFLQVSPKVCIERISKSRYDFALYEKEEILKRVWQEYEILAREYDNIYIIEGEQSVEKVHKDVLTIINRKLKG